MKRFGFVAAMALLVVGATGLFAFLQDQGVLFIRPGLVIQVQSAQVAGDGTITVEYTLADPKGVPLDQTGVNTAGTISLSFIAATIPKGQEQYVAYTTRAASGAAVPSTRQAAADSGGATATVTQGRYRYTLGTKAPAGYDATATHTIGIYGSRDLTPFGLTTSYGSTTYNFVPAGGTVTNVRDVIRTQSCNRCHGQLSFHGGSRRGIELCVLCHTPQTLDPDTGNTVDLKVMAHKIHLGEDLPSVQAGKPYQIIGFQGAVADYSTVVDPADARRCEVCHDQTSGATQASYYLSKPTRVTCGSCHDDVNFDTGQNHAGGPQISDNLCANCHIPQGELDFDASIKGAHTVPVDSTMLSGLVAEITKVSNTAAGSKPTVTFTVKDKSGAGVPLSQLSSLSLTMAGPTSDYGYTSFGPNITTPGYVTESARTASNCGSDGTCTYSFTNAIPASAKGTYAIGIEGRRTETLLNGTLQQMSVQYGLVNKVTYFSVDGSAVQPRRTVVTIANCNQCHYALSLHGTLRNQAEYCAFCHNPSNTDISQRTNAQDPAQKAMPPQGINFNLLAHRIHYGENLQEAGRSYIVIGFGGSTNDFSDVRYPQMSPTGSPGDTRYCAACHTNGSEQTLPGDKNAVVDPQGPINPVQPITSVCTGCHVTTAAASHALANTTSLGESCNVCHSSTSDQAVSKVHAQY